MIVLAYFCSHCLVVLSYFGSAIHSVDTIWYWNAQG